MPFPTVESFVGRSSVEWQLYHLRMAIEMGACSFVRKITDAWGSNFQSEGSQFNREEYAWLIKKAKRMYEMETIHGEGSLLELDHPMVTCLMASKEPVFNPEEIAAAKRRNAINDRGSDVVSENAGQSH